MFRLPCRIKTFCPQSNDLWPGRIHKKHFLALLSPTHQYNTLLEILLFHCPLEHRTPEFQTGNTMDKTHRFFSVSAGELLEVTAWPPLNSVCGLLLWSIRAPQNREKTNKKTNKKLRDLQLSSEAGLGFSTHPYSAAPLSLPKWCYAAFVYDTSSTLTYSVIPASKLGKIIHSYGKTSYLSPAIDRDSGQRLEAPRRGPLQWWWHAGVGMAVG